MQLTAVHILRVSEDRVEGSRCGRLCGSVVSESIMVRVQAGRDVIFDVLENKLLKAIHQDGCECHRAVVIKSRNSRQFS